MILPPMNHHGNGHLPSRSDSGSNMGSLNAIGKTGIRLADGDAKRNREFLGDERFAVADGTGASEFFSSHLRCDQPAKLRGRILMEMEPHRFCDAPLILKVAIQDIQPYSVHVSWQTREHSGLHGYHVVYRSMEDGGDSNEVSVFDGNCCGLCVPPGASTGIFISELKRKFLQLETRFIN